MRSDPRGGLGESNLETEPFPHDLFPKRPSDPRDSRSRPGFRSVAPVTKRLRRGIPFAMDPLRSSLPALLLFLVGPAAALDYHNDILPILKEHCWDCHSNEKEAKGGLALDDIEGMTKVQIGEISLIRPGDPDKSDFLARLKLDDEDDDFMPKNGKALRPSELAKIEQWIRSGAVLDAANPTPAELERVEAIKLANARAGGEEYFSWTNAQGVTIEARFAGLQGDSVKIVMRNRREFVVPLSTLDAESVALAKRLGEP